MMLQFLDSVPLILSRFIQMLDVFLVYLLIYYFLKWARNTHAFDLMRGLVGVLMVYLLSQMLGMDTLHWILERFSIVLLLLVIIVFQPELRRFLENIGSFGHLLSPLLSSRDGQSTVIIKGILTAIELLSKERIGALIVIEVGTNLSEYVESGIKTDAYVSSALLSNLFWPGSPTHDGAVIIREHRVEAAGCLLPLTDTRLDDRRLGTRHRAALGLSEVSDALVFVVSEETGIISLAEKGNLTRYLTKEAMESRLFNLYQEEEKIVKVDSGFKRLLSYFLKFDRRS